MNAPNWGTQSRKPDEALKQAMNSLERALANKTAGREYQWSAAVADALDLVQRAMHSRPADPTSSEAVDDTRPTLARQADEVRREYSHCVDRVEGLRVEIKRVTNQFAPKKRSKARDEADSIPNFAEIRERGTDLLACLQHIREEEANLVLESVNTDIGVGD